MDIDFLILVVCDVAIALLATLIFVRNPSQANNRRFLLLSLALVLWVSFNFLSDNLSTHPKLLTRLTFFAGLLSIGLVLNFVANFPNAIRRHVAFTFQQVLTLLFLPAVFTPQFIRNVNISVHTATVKTSFLYPVFLVYVAFSIIVLIMILSWQTRSAKTAFQKQQAQLLSYGIVLFAALSVIFNVLLPLILSSWSSSRFGPAFTLLFVGVVGYSIVKHKLFDIHFFVVRGAAYSFSVLMLSLVYILPVVLFLAYIADIHFTTTEFAAGVVLTLIFVLSYQRVRRVFDNITNRLFLRGYYEPQAALNKLSNLLVGTIDIENIKTGGSKIVRETLRTNVCDFSLVAQQEAQADSYLRKLFPRRSSQNVVVIDDLSDDRLVRELRADNIALVIRLRTAHNDLGIMKVGYRESGELYNDKDKQLLSIAADEIAISMQNAIHFRELQELNLSLQDRVEEATRKLRASNEKLKALDETKDDFISMASHQLRTPLTSVKGYLSMLLEGDAGKVNATQRQMLGQAFVSSQRMVYLISDLLNVSRLRTGKFVIEAAPTDLASMIQEELAQLVEAAAARGIELKYVKPKDFPLLMLDETKTRQVIMNFIDNAIYYTPSGGHIEIRLAETPNSVELRVIDDGIGVPRAEQHHLFTKFYRAKNAQRARPDGTGLGLFMAKKVVLGEGGTLIFDSTEGKGSTFGFSLPKHKLEVSAKPAEAPSAKKPAKTLTK